MWIWFISGFSVPILQFLFAYLTTMMCIPLTSGLKRCFFFVCLFVFGAESRYFVRTVYKEDHVTLTSETREKYNHTNQTAVTPRKLIPKTMTSLNSY